MHTLVTGGAGFIGSTLVDRLLSDGHTVDVVDDFSSGSLHNLEAARRFGDALKVLTADVRLESTETLIANRRPEVIFHLAAQPSVVASTERPLVDADVNIFGTLRVLEATRRAPVRKVVFAASGGTLYGDVAAEQLPATEALAYGPTSPYGLSKRVALDYLTMYEQLYGIDFSAMALANVYGPRQDPHGEAGVVAIFSDLIARGEPPVIFGDGEQTRDFVYVDDVVDAFVLAATRAPSGGIFNVSTGVETSVNALVGYLADASNEPVVPSYAPARPGEVRRSALSPLRAQRMLGWRARTPIATGVQRVVDSRRHPVRA